MAETLGANPKDGRHHTSREAPDAVHRFLKGQGRSQMPGRVPGTQREPIIGTHKDSGLTFPVAALGLIRMLCPRQQTGQLKKNTPSTTRMKGTLQKFHLQLPVTRPH